jgi:hypothetical protein
VAFLRNILDPTRFDLVPERSLKTLNILTVLMGGCICLMPWFGMYIRHDFHLWFRGLVNDVLCVGLLSNYFALYEILNRRIPEDAGDRAFLRFIRQRLAGLVLGLMMLVAVMGDFGASLPAR